MKNPGSFLLLSWILMVQVLGTSSNDGELLADVDNIPVAIEWDRSVVQDEQPPEDGLDHADIQNAEDDQEQECSPGVEYIRDPKDCSKFYQCSNGVAYHMSCQPGLYFDIESKVCAWPSSVNCDADRCDRRKIGRRSGTGNDDQSIATCPQGYWPVDCTSSDPRRSDGNIVEGRDCVAVNGQRGEGQRAIVTCVSAGEGDYVYRKSGDWERNPSVQCPYGYRLIKCLLRNPWNDIRFAFPVIDVSRNACTSDITCLAGWGCLVQAMCRRRA